jgi:uncharacterized protein YjbI with pentapeptide repeats
MANQEHWSLLRQGIKTVWNKWRAENPETIPDLSKVDLHSINLQGADFSRADLSISNLCHANLTEANLYSVNLIWADLTKANLSDTNLRRANLRETNLTKANLIAADLTKADLTEANLSGADLRGANLRGVDFFKANLSGADLRGTNLNDADLRRADLSGANLTGANLQKARISQETIIEEKWRQVWESAASSSQDDITAVDRGDEVTEIDLSNKFQAPLPSEDYRKVSKGSGEQESRGAEKKSAILHQEASSVNDGSASNNTSIKNPVPVKLPQGQQEQQPINIHAHSALGEPTKEFQNNQQFVDLVFHNGINWEAFLTAFHKLQLECGGEAFTIQAIEHNNNTFILRVNVPVSAIHEEIQKCLKQEYDLELKAIEEKYRVELQAEDNNIHIYHQQSTNLTEIIKLLADITIYDFEYSQIPGNITNEDIRKNQTSSNIGINPRQNLVETRVQIQQLLYEIAQTNPTTHEVVAEAIHQEIQHNSMLKARLQAALNTGGQEALKVIFNHPLYSIPMTTIKGWLETE